MLSVRTAKDEILAAVDPVEFYRSHFPEWKGTNNDLVRCPREAAHGSEGDSTPSLSLEPHSGAFCCFGCGWKGTSVVGFACDLGGDESGRRTIAGLYARYIRPTIPLEKVGRYSRQLDPKLRARVTASRGWTSSTIRRLRIGWCSTRTRTVIPIYSLCGICLDLRFHDSLNMAHHKNGKRVPMLGPDGCRTGDWYPLNPLVNPFDHRHQEVWVVEGEPDAILGWQSDLNIVTVTGGAGALASLGHDRLALFEGRSVILCLDNDKAGRKADAALTERLAAVSVASLKSITVPIGKDLTEFYLRHSGSASQLRQVASVAPYVFKPKKRVTGLVPLADTGKSEHIHQLIHTEVLVNGKNESPINIPKRIKFSCKTSDKCIGCPCAENGYAEHVVLKEDPNVIKWIYQKDIATGIKADRNINKRCPVMVDNVEEYQTIEVLKMIPSLSIRESRNKYASRKGYYLGHGLESNRCYQITAIPTVHPSTKESVLMVLEASGSHDAIQGFQLESSDVSRLREMFDGDARKKLREICHVHSRNHTRIVGRWDLHLAVDLAFHSPSELHFAGTRVPKGSMEIVLFGDTRCGKGQVAEGLVAAYDLGCVVSGENASFVGLVGGAQKSSDGFSLVWGAIPTNHRRLVVVDEFSSFDDLGRMSRVRSEGIAEMDKGFIHAKTSANARLIWIANLKKGKDIASYSSGVEALMNLIGTNEDLARFDLAIAVAKGEVATDEINRNSRPSIRSEFSREALRQVVLWVWSREQDHILFTKEAEEEIYTAANYLASRYSSTIPLVQGENIRFKLAKVASAIAGRLFSTPDGTMLRVTGEHAKLASSLFVHYYDKPVMGYLNYSQIEASGKDLKDLASLDRMFAGFGDNEKIVIDGMMSSIEFWERDLQDWIGSDSIICKKRIGTLVRCNAIRKTYKGQGYAKRPSFTEYLRKRKRELS